MLNTGKTFRKATRPGSADIIALSPFAACRQSQINVSARVYGIRPDGAKEEILCGGIRRPITQTSKALTEAICAQAETILFGFTNAVVLAEADDRMKCGVADLFADIVLGTDHTLAFLQFLDDCALSSTSESSHSYSWDNGAVLHSARQAQDDAGRPCRIEQFIVLEEYDGQKWIGIFQTSQAELSGFERKTSHVRPVAKRTIRVVQ